MTPRLVKVTTVLRYARGGDPTAPTLDGYVNYDWFTRDPAAPRPRVLLESGINKVAKVTGPDGPRRPVVPIRSSPWKAGRESNPWHDEFDLDHGHVRYLGDHKTGKPGAPGSADDGNRLLLSVWPTHLATDRTDRATAPPLMIFRARTVTGAAGGKIPKGHVEFCGAAVIERIEYIVQRDPLTGTSFPNLSLDLAVLDLSDTGDGLDWRWIDDRRDPELSHEQTLRHAPRAWRRWVDEGSGALPRLRRRVAASRLQTADAQRPDPGSDGATVLAAVYRHFDGSKHSFEHLAARVAGVVLGPRFTFGWLTRSGGDGGLDFVGRLDVGSAPAVAPMIVLGQAKCVDPSKNLISADQLARLVARLQRGWIGVFVTTSVFSKAAQTEMIDDRYPVVLIHGRQLAEVVTRIAQESFGGDVKALLDASTDAYRSAVTSRRPEEVLGVTGSEVGVAPEPATRPDRPTGNTYS